MKYNCMQIDLRAERETTYDDKLKKNWADLNWCWANPPRTTPKKRERDEKSKSENREKMSLIIRTGWFTNAMNERFIKMNGNVRYAARAEWNASHKNRSNRLGFGFGLGSVHLTD